jgi:hypothetical protein
MKLTRYDVRLNSSRPESSVKKAPIDFAAYPPTKRLFFYIFDETPNSNEDKPPTSDCYIEFQLMAGGTVQKSQAVDVKEMTSAELMGALKQIFHIENNQPIQLIDSKGNCGITLEPHESP